MSRKPVHPVHRFLALLAAAAVVALAPAARAQLIMNELPDPAKGLDVEEKLGAQIPEPLMVHRSDGMAVDVAAYFKGDKPAILVLAYYDCPVVCPLTFERLIKTLNDVPYTVGEDFRVVVVSFDPTNTAEMAERERQLAMASYDRQITREVQSGFLFHIASEQVARRLADSVGYRYNRLANGEYSHPVALMVMTPGGRVSRYVYGFNYPARDVRMALLEASDGKIGRSIGDAFLHFCYAWDPTTGGFTLQAWRLMQLVGVLTVVLIGVMIGVLLARERLRAHNHHRTQRAGAPGASAMTGQAT